MKTITHTIRSLVLTLLVLTDLIAKVTAQEVAIPDPGLNAAIRETLRKPAGPLTPQDMLALTNLNACCRNVSRLDGLEAASNLIVLTIQFNRITNFSLPPGLTKMNTLDVSFNPLTNCSLPLGLTNLTTLLLAADGLTHLALPEGLTHLIRLEVAENHLTDLTLPQGLTNLTLLDLTSNQLTQLSLPPDLTRLNALALDGNALTTLVLSEPLAATNLTETVAALRNQGVTVFTYPLTIQLMRLRQPTGTFQFVIAGPPGDYTVLSSTDLARWTVFSVQKFRQCPRQGRLRGCIGPFVFTEVLSRATAKPSGEQGVDPRPIRS